VPLGNERREAASSGWSVITFARAPCGVVARLPPAGRTFMTRARSRVDVVREVDGARFLASDLPPGRVAVLFCADWCGYCHRFTPAFRRASPDAWIVDVSDEESPPWDAFAIRVVPTVILFEDGEPRKRWAGILGEREAEEIASIAKPGP
jgi:thiol-disulfide isomerase/thioredoxin